MHAHTLTETTQHDYCKHWGWESAVLHVVHHSWISTVCFNSGIMSADSSIWVAGRISQGISLRDEYWGRERSSKDKEEWRRENKQKRELLSVCSGLIRVIISLSLPGPSPELAYTCIHTHTHIYIYIYIQMHIHTHREKIERGGEVEKKRIQIKDILMSGIRKTGHRALITS